MCYRLLLVSLLVWGLSGCLGPAKVPPVSSYTISTLHTQKIPTRAHSRRSLLVTSMIADPGYQTADMVYVNVPYRLKSFAQNRWIAPPSQLLQSLLIEKIRQAGYFAAVVTPPFSGSTPYRLDTRLLKLQQEFLQPTSQLVMQIQATLINTKSNRIIKSQRFTIQLPARQNTPYAGVLATNKAANLLLRKVARMVIANAR